MKLFSFILVNMLAVWVPANRLEVGPCFGFIGHLARFSQPSGWLKAGTAHSLVSHVSLIVKIAQLYPATAIPGVQPRKMKTYVYINTCVRGSYQHYSQQPEKESSPNVHRLIDGQQSVVCPYSRTTTQRSRAMQYTDTYYNTDVLQNIMLSERRQSQNTMIPYI